MYFSLVGTACVSPSSTPTATPAAVPSSTPQCPVATPEAFWVNPLPATTDQLSIVVHVSLGHMEEVTVVTESGTFTSSTSDVEVTLLPNTAHHLEVTGKVEVVQNSDGCQYGGYTLSTRFDEDFNPLVIEQRSP